MSPPTAIRPSRPEQAASLLRRVRPIDALIAVLIAVMILPLSRIAFQPNFIEGIAFENPSVYDLTIQVNDGGTGWMAVTTARRHSTTVANEVYDIGNVWAFRFTAQGEYGGEVRVTRSELASAGWHLVIPEQIGAQLQAKGVHEPP
jgi:hypothetical protein